MQSALHTVVATQPRRWQLQYEATSSSPRKNFESITVACSSCSSYSCSMKTNFRVSWPSSLCDATISCKVVVGNVRFDNMRSLYPSVQRLQHGRFVDVGLPFATLDRG